MMKRIQASLAALALSAALHPAPVLAGSGPSTSYVLATRQTDTNAGGEFDGRLRIQITPGGIVSGTFMDSEGQISGVSGGLDGTKIWIDLRAASPGTSRVFTGTFVNGRLSAGTTRGLHVLRLEGTPVAR